MEFLESMVEIVHLGIPVLDNIPGLREIIGSLLVFFAPGFAWTLIFFKKLTVIERVVLSVALSIAIISLLVLGLNFVFGLPLTGLTSFLVIFVITIIPLGIHYRHRLFGRKSKAAEEMEEQSTD